MNKDGANPSSYIALLVFVIGVILIVYILMLPPGDRADLLDQNRTGHEGDTNYKFTITTLMTEEPGTINNIAEDTVTRDLPSINLFTRTDTKELVSFDSMYIKKSLFEEQDMNVSFSVDDTENTDNIVLSYSTPIHEGRLEIILNGIIIFNEPITTSSPPPLKLSKDYLKAVNTIEFKVSGPGVEFWKTNEYSFRNLVIYADITDKSGQTNKQKFVVTQEEYDNLQYLQLEFLPDCKAIDSGTIQIYLNKFELYRGVPDCGYLMDIPPVDKKRVHEGENDLLFMTEKGNYLLDNMHYTLKLEQPVFPTYYFYVNDDLYNKIKDDTADVNVTLTFNNAVDQKKGTVFVNGVFFDINTYDMDFNKQVDQYIRSGNNVIEIRPETKRLDVLELKVLVAE